MEEKVCVLGEGGKVKSNSTASLPPLSVPFPLPLPPSLSSSLHSLAIGLELLCPSRPPPPGLSFRKSHALPESASSFFSNKRYHSRVLPKRPSSALCAHVPQSNFEPGARMFQKVINASPWRANQKMNFRCGVFK